MKIYLLLACLPLFLSCTERRQPEPFSLNRESRQLTHIKGEKENGDYLYVTAGNALYSIGNQYGQFPEVGFHVPGEMGGIWQHPIKLLDGFQLTVNQRALDKSDQFITYPFANQFEYNLSETLDITRTDFVPDSLPVLVVEYQIQNKTATSQAVDLQFTVNSDLSPVWLGERSGMTDSRDTLVGLTSGNTFIIKDKLNDWYTGVTSDVDNLFVESTENSPWKGQGISVTLKLPALLLSKNEVKNIRFYISGSMKNPTEIKENLRVAKDHLEDLFTQKKERYRNIDRIAAITIPDTVLMKAYQWGKYNNDWLVRDVPGLGNGMSAGLPDYPWFFSNDQSITFGALVGTRQPDLFYNSLAMIKKVSDEYNNHSGRIVHEFSTNGAVYDKGRMEESQEFIIAAWHVFEWTGNKEFMKIYYDHGKKVWEFLQAHDTNHNLYVEGFGGVEIEGLNDEMLDVAVHTQSFLEVMGEAALVFEEPALSADYANKAAILKQKINEDWWSPSEKRFADFISDKQKAIRLIDMTLEKRVIEGRNEWARKKLLDLKQRIQSGQHNEKGYTVLYNAAAILPLTEGIADPKKAYEMLESVPFFTNKFGIYVAGIARPDDITSEEGSVAHRLTGEFNYNEAIMMGATSKLAIAECRYRGFEYARKYIGQILNNFSFATPGSTYEVSPDYGMFVQAWNVLGINVPLIQYAFGVKPNAYKREISIHTDIPSDWNYAKLERLLIGNNQLSIDYKNEKGKRMFTIEGTEDNWNIHFSLPQNTTFLKINGVEQEVLSHSIILQGLKNNIEIR